MHQLGRQTGKDSGHASGKFSHVLITRPRTEAEELAGMLKPLNIEGIVLPAYDFLACDVFPDQVSVMQNAARDQSSHLIVFTSPRAVQYGIRQVPAELLKQSRIAAMGPSTAQIIEEAGLTVSLHSEKAYATEGLLGALQLEGRVSATEPRHAFILAAPGGRTRLKEGLAALGYKAHMLMVYERRPSELPGDSVAEIGNANSLLSVWTSANTMNSLAQRLPASTWLRMCHGEWLVISDRLRRLARAFSPGRIHLSAGPSNNEILNAIRDMG